MPKSSPAWPAGSVPFMQRQLRVALLSPPFLPVPPPGYAGTERVVAALAQGLHERGHHVTLFAPADSDVPYELVPSVPQSLWRNGYRGDASSYIEATVGLAWAQAGRFDLIHSHLDTAAFNFARHSPTPVLSTLHRRLDTGGAADMIDAYPDVALVAISDNQRRWNPGANWIATIHHGLDYTMTPQSNVPGDYLLVVGRIAREKGIEEAIEVARRTERRLVVAAKVWDPREKRLFDAVVRPHLKSGLVDWRGEVDDDQRDELMAGAFVTLMLGAWPEPFGLVAIESMATGTPIIARRAGANTETVQHGVTGFLVDDVDEAVHAVSRVAGLDRAQVAAHARTNFSAERMVTQYERAYEQVLSRSGTAAAGPLHLVPPRGADKAAG